MANDLMDLLQGQLTDGLLDQMSAQLGGASKEQTAVAASGIFNTLVGALAKNASTPEGANSLVNALDNDHDGSILDNITDIFQGQSQAQNVSEKTLNGAGILNHLLGDRQDGAASMISQMSGLNKGQTGNLMSMLAPMVLGTLGKQRSQGGLDVASIASLLTGTVSNQRANSTNPAMGLVTQFLDSDGDGSIVDDVANIGMKLLGNLFKK